MTISTHHAAPSRANGVARRANAVLLTTCFGVFLAQLDSSVVFLGLKHIGGDLNASISEMQWVLDSYNLVYATFLLTGGALGDLYGRLRVFACGIALIVIGVGLGLNTGPVNAAAVTAVPAARSGTASGLLNTARMTGATMGIALLGAIYAAHAQAGGTQAMLDGLHWAFLGGAIAELGGVVIALVFTRADSMMQKPV